MTSTEKKVDRRRFIGYGVSAIAGAVIVGAAGYYVGLASAPPPRTTTVTVPGAVTTVTAAGGATTVTATATRTVTATSTVTAMPTIQGPIRLGILTSKTGFLAFTGNWLNKGYQMAIDEINAAGGLYGAKIEAIYEDTQGKPEVADAVTERLITRDKVDFLFAPVGSQEAFTSTAIAERNNALIIVSNASGDDITERGFKWI